MTLFSRMMTSDVCCSQYCACPSREYLIMSIANADKWRLPCNSVCMIDNCTLHFKIHKGHSMSSEPNFQHSDPRMKLSICEAKMMNSFGDFFFNFKKVGFLKIQISKIFWMVCETKQRRKIRSHSDPRMKLSMCEAKIITVFAIF
jgi:hypothetical protein